MDARNGLRRTAAVAAAAAVAVGAGACGAPTPPPRDGPVRDGPAYVGRMACRECHAEEVARWTGSHHDLALQPATEGTVLADFDGFVFPHGAGSFRFFRRDDAFLVEVTDGTGAARELPVAWTFGVSPLQQYLVRMGDGRLQVLPIAWDARPEADGGGRWYDIFPDAITDPSEVLSWTGPALSWNRMCADCHSTGLEKNWDPTTERYATTWAEEDVACEACHGRGSEHVAWGRRSEAERALRPDAGLEVRVGNGLPGAWILEEGKATATLQRPRPVEDQVETCGRCHAHRARIAPDDPSAPLSDSHVVSLLDAGLTWPDGQVLDEVFEYGSFRQSRMAAKGVVCTDCHDPHSARLRFSGDDVCARCHRPEVFATREHHGHDPLQGGARCTACHMPTHVFMGVDERVDHGFRVPRPDLSVALGTPNACNDCHRDKDAAWAADAVAKWTGGRAAERPSWGPAIAAAQRWQEGADAGLLRWIDDAGTPAIVRATALGLLRDPAAPAAAAAVERGAVDPDPLVRRAAAGLLAALPDGGARRTLGARLLADPVGTVRQAAVLPLLEGGALPRGRASVPGLEAAIDEFRAAQAFLDDGADGAVNLGNLELALGRVEAAEAAYRRALRRQPSFVPAAVNLADLLRATGRVSEAAAVLEASLALAPDAGAAHHALGLVRVLQDRRDDAIASLRRATETAPDEPRFAHVLAVALEETGRGAEAAAVRDDVARRFPGYPAPAPAGRRGGRAAPRATANSTSAVTTETIRVPTRRRVGSRRRARSCRPAGTSSSRSPYRSRGATGCGAPSRRAAQPG